MRRIAFAAIAGVLALGSAQAQVLTPAPSSADFSYSPVSPGSWSYRAVAGGSEASFIDGTGTARMTAEFYLQTVDAVFQRHLLPKGELKHRGKKVDPGAIKDTALLAIEGERDDISGIGQTKAALEISTGLAKAKKEYFLAPEVGHYGIFNGRKWREKIAPVVEAWIAKND